MLINQTGGSGGGSSDLSNIMGSSTVQDSVKFNKKLLDYDYGEDEDDNDKGMDSTPHVPNILEVIKVSIK